MTKSDEKWNKHLRELVEFIRINNKFPSAISNNDNERKLGHWARNNLVRYRKGNLEDYRVRAIASLIPTFFTEPFSTIGNRYAEKHSDLVQYIPSKILEYLNKLGINNLEELAEVYRVKDESLYNKVSDYLPIKYNGPYLECKSTRYTKLYKVLRHKIYSPIVSSIGTIYLFYNTFGYYRNSENGIGIPDKDIISIKRFESYRDYIISTLTPREQDVLTKRYIEIRTQNDIGKELGITGGRVGQIESKAIRKLRHPSRVGIIRDIRYALSMLKSMIKDMDILKLDKEVVNSRAFKQLILDIQENYKLSNYTYEFILGLLYFGIFDNIDQDNVYIIARAVYKLNTISQSLEDSNKLKIAYDLTFNQGNTYGKKVDKSNKEAYIKIIQDEINKIIDIYYAKLRLLNSNTEDYRENQATSIDSLGLSVRAYNVLTRANIKTLYDLKKKSINYLSKLRNMGPKTLEEITDLLDRLALEGK